MTSGSISPRRVPRATETSLALNLNQDRTLMQADVDLVLGTGWS